MWDPLAFALENRVALIAVCLTLMVVGERVAPGLEWRGGLSRVLRNFGLWTLNFVLVFALVLPLTAWASESIPGWRPVWLEGAAGFAIDILILDLLWYWWHRAHHVVPLLWRFHEVHHLDEFIDTSTAYRTHTVEMLLSIAVRVAVVLALDISFVSLLAFELVGTIICALQHCNARLAPPWLGRALSLVFVTPSVHWVHHFSAREYMNCNFGLIFCFWDRVFGSFRRKLRSPDTGIGVEGKPDTSLTALLVDPFRTGRTESAV